ncbi:MAG: zinc ABC transporter substrate-binding protein, partial [Alphaproteobacteria bacterium]
MKVLLLALTFLLAPFYTHASAPSKVLTVVTTFPILQDLTQQIVGDRAGIRVYSIVKGKADPHTYQPKTDDGKIVANADLIITNGLGFEAGWMDRLITSSGSKARVFIAAQSIKPRILILPHSGDPVPDPHTWHNVRNAIAIAKVILDALTSIDPDGRTHYEAQ